MLKRKKVDVDKLPFYLLHIFTILLIICSLIILGNKYIEYKSVIQKEQYLLNNYANKENQIEELNYFLEAEIDNEYKEKMAKIKGYCYPDETIQYVK